MQIMEIDGHRARCTARGVEREVNLFLLQGQALSPGDYVLVHVGYAIQGIDAPAAQQAWQTWQALQSGAGHDA
jgi:hydrogenase expression/formation protein HypC